MNTQVFTLYENRSDVTLTAYLINEDNELTAQGSRPGILILPGGGYFNCSDREAEPVALYFASLGYHAFVLRYSTYLQGQPGFPDLSKPLAPKPETAHPAPVREVGLAMKILAEHADAWKLDSRRIAVCGFSAGAHNAAMYGVYWNKPLVADYVGVPAEQIRPAALILSYTLSDYLFMEEYLKTAAPMEQGFFNASTAAFLGKTQYTQEELRAISPALLVDDAVPPTFLWATSTDQMVPVQHSVLMAKALADHHIPFELHLYEGGDHGLSLATQATALAQTMLSKKAAEWTAEAADWLLRRFALDLPEMTDFEKSVV